MSDRILKVALVGAGFHSRTTLLTTLVHLPVRLQAVVDRDLARAESVAARFGCRAYADTSACYAAEGDLDAVLLCAGPSAHPRLIAEAAAAGLHVWSEKPAADRVADLDAIAPAVAASGKVVVVGYKKAFMPVLDKVREILARPESGPLWHVVGQYPVGLPQAWHANCCHPLSCMLAIGGPVERFRIHRHASGGGTISLQFRDGTAGTLILGHGTRGLSERYQFIAEGTHIEVEDGNCLRWHRGQRAGGDDAWIAPGDDHGSVTWRVQNCYARGNNRLEMTQGFHRELAYFCACVHEGRAPTQGTLAFARALTEIDEVALATSHDGWVACTSADWRMPAPGRAAAS